jgi:hypothetical protein
MRPVLLSALLLSIALLAGCGTPSFEDTPSTEFGDAQLYPVRGTGFNEVYASRDANLSSYEQIHAETLGLSDVRFSGPMLSGTSSSQWQITEPRGETLENAWRDAIDLAFKDYQQVDKGDKVLRIDAELLEVQRRNATITGTSATGLQSNRRDSVTIVVEIRLYDLASGNLLSVIRDRRDRHTDEWTRGSGQHMVNLFNSWTALLQARISGR